MVMVIASRSLRWTLAAGMPPRWFPAFWQSATIGYLGNMIYPARAGEVLRMMAIHHFAKLSPGRAVSSSIIDRLLDLMSLGIFTFVILELHGGGVVPAAVQRSVGAVFLLATLLIALFLFYGETWSSWLQGQLARRLAGRPALATRLHEWLEQAVAGLKILRQAHYLLPALLLNIIAFLLDGMVMWLALRAFGWDLPYSAGLTTAVFIIMGASLPSAPGYVGIYQVACVLALSLYGIAESQAVAYSIVLQLLAFLVIALQGGWVALHYGFRLRAPGGQNQPFDQKINP
jgi:uncharacterized protein (TIRG00374 family)